MKWQLWFCEAHIAFCTAQIYFILKFHSWSIHFQSGSFAKKRNQNDWLTWQLHINYRQLHNWIAFKHSFHHLLISFVCFSFCKLRLHVIRRQNVYEKREKKIYSQHVFRWNFIAHIFLIFQLNQRLIETIVCLLAFFVSMFQRLVIFIP